MIVRAFPLLTTIILTVLLLSSGTALAETARYYLIKRQTLERAIQQLALQSGRQVVFAPSPATQKMSNGVSGNMTAAAALRQLLAGTGLAYRENPSGVILIEQMPVRPRRAEPAPNWQGMPATSPMLLVTAFAPPDPTSFVGDLQRSPRSYRIDKLLQNVVGMSAQETGAGQQSIIVRGVGLTGETTTIVYFGGVPISGPAGTGNDGARTTSDLALVDIDYVRSSRTSRGTEHGIGALAGEVEIEPQRPKLGRWEGNATLGASLQQGGKPGFLLTSTLNAPVGDNIAVRMTGYVRTTGGYIDNARTGQSNVNDDDIKGIRLAGRYAPYPALDADLLFLWQHRRIADSAAWLRGLGAYTTDRYFSAPTTHDFKLARLKVAYAPGPVQLETISALYSWHLDRNYDRTNVTFLQSTDDAGCQRYFGIVDQDCSDAQSSEFSKYVTGFTPTLLHIPIVSYRAMQEIRLEQTNAEGLNWTWGALFDWRREKARSELSATQTDNPADPAYFGVRELEIRRTQTSVFADISWKHSPGYTVSAGVRYDRHTVSSRNDVVVPNIISGSITSWPTTTVRTSGLHARLHGDVPVTDAIFVHAQMNRSFRPGGVNIASVLVPDRYTYDADSLWGYEFGLKWRFMQTAQLTLTSYVNDWQDIQYRAMSENRSHAYLVNIGNASITGMDVELRVQPMKGITARVMGSLIKGRLTRTRDETELIGGAQVGDQIPFVPDKRLQASVGREWRLSDDKKLTLEAEWQYQSGFWSTFSRDDPDFLATRGFHLFNADIQYETERTSVSLGIKNIFDRVANLRALTTGFGVGQSFSVGPRQLSLRWSRRW